MGDYPVPTTQSKTSTQESTDFTNHPTKVPCVISYGQILMNATVGAFLRGEPVTHSDETSAQNGTTTMV